MKQRKGFVSNSSSSSFICEVCNGIESGWDASYSDVGMQHCESGHVWHESCAKSEATPEQKINALRALIETNTYLSDQDKAELTAKIVEAERDAEYIDDLIGEYFEDGLPACECPMCMFSRIYADDAVEFLYRKFNLTREAVIAEIKATFASYTAFKAYLAGAR